MIIPLGAVKTRGGTFGFIDEAKFVSGAQTLTADPTLPSIQINGSICG